MNASKLIQVYIEIRDAKAQLEREYEDKVKELTTQLEAIEGELLEICKATGQDGGKTEFGSFSRIVKSRYWTSDWDSMYSFIREHNAPELLEKRIHQGNFKEFLSANPELLPAGLNVDSKYSITVRRSK